MSEATFMPSRWSRALRYSGIVSQDHLTPAWIASSGIASTWDRTPASISRSSRWGGSHRQRTVAHDDGGNAVIARIGAKRIPGDLGIVMSVVVDDSGRRKNN